MTVVDDIKDRVDIVELIGESVNLKKSGKNYTGFCPFHPNTRTPAFVVFPDTGTWRCFGACNEGGDVFSFLMKKEGFDFREALRVLAQRAGVELRPRTPEEEARAEEHDHLRSLLETAVTFFRHQLLQSAAGADVMEYLEGRNLSAQTIEHFELGYAPNSWEALLGHFRDKGQDEGELLQAGLVSQRDSGGYFDRFRHRLIIPIRDHRGRMVGFGARALDPDERAKYLNSPQTELFDKGNLLYGLDKSKKAIRSQDQAVMVEGYMDVIGLHQAGFQNAVSPMGTALTESQLRLLKRYSRKIVLALDADAAGDRATLRGLDVAREAMDREFDPVFAARGLVRYEGRLDAELRIVTLPEGMDPDELVAADPQSWTALVNGAQPVVDYVLDTLIRERNLEDAKHKAEIAERVLPLIEDVADPVEREAYRQNLARRLRVDERALLRYKKGARRPRRQQADQPALRSGGVLGAAAGDVLERFCLGVALQRPEILYRMDREMQELELERVSELDFSGTDRRAVFGAIRAALAQHDVEPGLHWRGELDEALIDAAEEMIRGLPSMELDESKVLAEISAAFLRLRKGALARQTSQVQFQLMMAQEVDEASEGEREGTVEDLKEEVQGLAIQKARLERALAVRGPAKASVASEGW